MEKEKVLKVKNFAILCREYYGYNDHDYVTLFDDTENQCRYLSQLTDCRIDDSNLKSRVLEYVESHLEY